MGAVSESFAWSTSFSTTSEAIHFAIEPSW